MFSSAKSSFFSLQKSIRFIFYSYSPVLKPNPLSSFQFRTWMATYSAEKQTSLLRAKQLVNEGNSELEKQLMHSAIGKYLESTKLLPSSEAFYNLGNVYLQLGRPEDALNYYQRSLDLEVHVDTLTNMANVYFLIKKDMDRAIQLYTQILELQTNDGQVWFNLGCIYDTKATQQQKQQRENELNHSTNIGSLHHQEEAMKAWTKAEECFQKAKELGIEQAEMCLRNTKIKKQSQQCQVNLKT